MNELERYLFDVQGFIVVENALTPDRLEALQKLVNEKVRTANAADANFLRFDSILGWGKAFREIIDNSRVVPYLQALLGEKFRLDHDYIHILRRGKGPVGSSLHGGGTPYDPSQDYHVRQNQMFNGLVAVAYELNHVNPTDGGFACVPGSHKSNFPLPATIRELENLHPSIRRVAAPSGSAIIFTEALSHGTIPWQGQSERRTLFYKYSPQFSGWARYYYDCRLFPDLTDSQRQILQTPGVYP